MDINKYPCVKVYFDEEDLTKCNVLIVGLPCTPYARGFFYFFVRFPPNYPEQPPKVKLMNTGGGRVRFNPNIYKNGMVCHSLLGTWTGPFWDPHLNNLSDVLEVIVFMLNEEPYKNEPFVTQRNIPELREGDVERYNDVIRHETLRVAVCDMMEGTVDMPEAMREEMTRRFLHNYPLYIEMCEDHMKKDGKAIKDSDPFFNIDEQLLPDEYRNREKKVLVIVMINRYLAQFLIVVQFSHFLAIIPLADIHRGRQLLAGLYSPTPVPGQSSAAQAESSHFAAAGHSETGPNSSFPEESLRYRTESRLSSNQTGTEADLHQPGVGAGLSSPDTQSAGNYDVPKVVHFNEARDGNFDYKSILQRIKSIKSDLDKAKRQECQQEPWIHD